MGHSRCPFQVLFCGVTLGRQWRDGSQQVSFPSAVLGGHLRETVERWVTAGVLSKCCFGGHLRQLRDGSQQVSFPSAVLGATLDSWEMGHSRYGPFQVLFWGVTSGRQLRDGAQQVWSFPSAAVLSGVDSEDCLSFLVHTCAIPKLEMRHFLVGNAVFRMLSKIFPGQLPPRWSSGETSASRAEDPGFESHLLRDFFEVESYE